MLGLLDHGKSAVRIRQMIGLPRFVSTPSGRIMLRTDYLREQESIAGMRLYNQREQLQREWRAAVRADEYDSRPCEDCGAEPGEPCRPYCTGKAAHDDETNNNDEGV